MIAELYNVDYHWGRIQWGLFLFALIIFLIRYFSNEELQPSQKNNCEGNSREWYCDFQEPVNDVGDSNLVTFRMLVASCICRRPTLAVGGNFKV